MSYPPLLIVLSSGGTLISNQVPPFFYYSLPSSQEDRSSFFQATGSRDNATPERESLSNELSPCSPLLKLLSSPSVLTNIFFYFRNTSVCPFFNGYSPQNHLGGYPASPGSLLDLPRTNCLFSDFPPPHFLPLFPPVLYGPFGERAFSSKKKSSLCAGFLLPFLLPPPLSPADPASLNGN